MDNPDLPIAASSLDQVTSPATLLRPHALRQNGAVTLAQASSAGLSRQQIRTLIGSAGWTNPVHGILVEPHPRVPFQAGLRAALLARPQASACHVTAARVHKLGGLPLWTPAEKPQLLLPGGAKQAQREGMQTFSGLRSGESVVHRRFAVTTLGRTLADLALRLEFDDFICALDSALHKGWLPGQQKLSRRQAAVLKVALTLADGLSESTLETHCRLLLVRAGVGPEVLQLRLFDRNGICYARLDMAWPSRRLALEADGRETHDKPEALFTDRRRQNKVMLDDWTVLRFTWFDVMFDPDWVVSQVRAALARRS